MKTFTEGRSFEKLIIAVGILVAIIAGLHASTTEDPKNISVIEVKAISNQTVAGENNTCQFQQGTRKIN